MNKLTKVLSIFVIAGVIGTGVAGVAGCKKHKHTYETTYTSYEDEGHAHKATCHPDVHDTIKPHADGDNDGLCDDCKYPMGGSQQATVESVTVGGATTGTVGTAVTLTATVTGSAGVAQTVTWAITEGGDIATITSGGVLTANAAGTVKVKATSTVDTTKYGEYTVVFSAAVVDPDATVESVTISGATEGKVGTPVTLTATVTGSAGVAQTVTWAITEGGDIASIDNGVLTATAAGTVKVVATSTADTTKSSEAHTVTFTAAEKSLYEELCEKDNKLYNNDFETAADRLPDFGGDFGIAKGVYTDFAVNKTTAGATKDTHYVKVEGGKAVQVNPGAGTTYTVVDFGGVKGVLEGYVEVTLSEAANSMTFIQFVGDSAAKTNSEVFGLRTDGGDVKYRLDGGSVVGAPTAIKTVTEMKVYFKYDQASKKMTVKIGDAVLCEELETTISKLTGFRIASGDSNTRTVNADNLVFCGTALTIADYREEKLTALAAAYGAYDSTLYSTDRYAQITAAKDTAEAAIGAAETMEEVLAAYNTAIAAMKNVPTIAGEGLYQAKEALKEEVEELYGASMYTYNAEAHAEAYAKIIAAIDAYSGEIGEEGDGEKPATGLYADAKIIAAVNELTENVKNDEDVIGDAKTAAVEALQALKGGSDSFVTNKTEYDAALTTHSNNIENVQLGDNVDKAAVEAALAQITAAKEAGEAAINAIKTDAELLEEAREAALKEIAEYKLAEVDALAPDGSITQENIEQVKNDVLTTRNLRSNAVRAASSIEAINAEVALAKTNIDSYLASLVETLEQVKARELQTLKDEYDKIIADIEDSVVLGILQDDYNGFVGRINGVTDEEQKSHVAEIRTEGVNLMRVRVARRTAYVDIAAYAEEVKGTIYNDAAKAEIDDEIRYDINTLTDQSKWSEDMWVIHNASTIAGVEEAKQTVIKAIDKIVSDLEAKEFTVSFKSGDNVLQESVSLKYGAVLTLDGIHITAKDVTGATVNGVALPEEGIAIYEDTEIVVTLSDKSGDYNPAEKWEGSKVTAATAVGGDGVVQDNGLYKLTVLPTSTFVSTGVANNSSGKQFTTATINGTAYGNVINVCSVSAGTNNSATPILLEIKDNLKSLKIYTLGAGANGTDSRQGSTYYVINDGEPIVVSGQAQAYELTNLKAGDIVKVYISNTSSSGGNLYLAKVEASIDESKVEEEVVVNWGDKTETYHYYDTITPPAAPVGGEGQKFDGWYYGDTKFEGGKLASGNYTMVAKFHEPNVIITYIVGSQTNTAKFYLEDGVTIKLPTPSGSSATEVFSHWSTAEGGDEVFNLSTITAGTSETPTEITLYAVFRAGTAVESVTISGENKVETGKTLQLTATVGPEDADYDGVTWNITEGGEFASIDENGVVTGIAVGTVKVTASAGGVVSEEFEITVEKPSITSESYLAEDMKAASNNSYEVDEVIVDKNLFSVSAATNLTGRTPEKTQAYPDRTDLGGYTLASADFEKRSSNDILKIEAKENIKITVFLTTDKSTLDGARAATVKFTVNGEAQATTSSIGSAKNTIDAVEITLNKGDTLVLNVTGTSGNSYTAYVFGIE
ncbi:MAG: Ig-like domain-containing protein, partial [Clostridia bacterium]|nr:Ig-like domain-containing protein [Clostridia bacterium]